MNLRHPHDSMKARILAVMGSLIVAACKEPQLSSEQPRIATPSPSARAVYLSRRVAVATDESLYGLEAGTELKLMEERPSRLLVEAQGVQFEIDQRDATSDRAQAERLLARAEEEKTIRQVAMATRLQIEDQKFLAQEDIRRRSAVAKQIADLHHAINSAGEEIARLEAAHPAPPGYRERNATNYETSSTASLEDSARQQRISFLQTYIADCNREIQRLSAAMDEQQHLEAQEGPR